MFFSLSSQLVAALPLIRLASAGWAAIPNNGSFHSLANVPDDGPLVNHEPLLLIFGHQWLIIHG